MIVEPRRCTIRSRTAETAAVRRRTLRRREAVRRNGAACLCGALCLQGAAPAFGSWLVERWDRIERLADHVRQVFGSRAKLGAQGTERSQRRRGRWIFEVILLQQQILA